MTTNDILKAIANKSLTVEEGSKLLAQAGAASGNGNTLRCKVSEKGAMSIYGLQRMPVTLYKEQWVRLFAFKDEAEKFLSDPANVFSMKGDK